LDQTEVKVCYDGENLYLAIHAYDVAADSLVAKEHPHDASEIYREDIIEILINPNTANRNFGHFVLNAVGSKADTFKIPRQKGQTKIAYISEWNPEWRVATSVLRNAWTAEVAIPFAVFARDLSKEIQGPPKPGDVWRINVAREKRTLELSAIRYMEGAGFRAVDKFARLVFE